MTLKSDHAASLQRTVGALLSIVAYLADLASIATLPLIHLLTIAALCHHLQTNPSNPSSLLILPNPAAPPLPTSPCLDTITHLPNSSHRQVLLTSITPRQTPNTPVHTTHTPHAHYFFTQPHIPLRRPPRLAEYLTPIILRTSSLLDRPLTSILVFLTFPARPHT